MQLPFATADFFALFARYNLAIGAAAWIAYALGVAVPLVLWRGTERGARFAWLTLALFWLWNGIAYHWLFFATINPAAYLFGTLFVVQGLLFGATGLRTSMPRFRLSAGPACWAGGLLVVYALLLYPLLGWLAGHHYPAVPLFGVAPCPTTIFTLGLLLWQERPTPWHLAVIPLAWVIVGGSAALLLQVPQDYGLIGAGLLALPLLRQRRQHTALTTQR